MPFFAFIILLFLTPATIAEENDPDAIRDGNVAIGRSDITAAWLIGETQRYEHYVRGTAFEASGIRLKTREGKTLTLWLDEGYVFEDRTPRLADLDRDGKDEIALVLTSVWKGAALAVYEVEDDQIVKKTQTPYIGQPYRWLNPAGIADLDGDGRLDIALVAMPHLVKRLEIWTLVDGMLHQFASANGFTNHRNGSAHTDMSVIADFNGDGIDDIALPSGDRQSIRIMGFENNVLVEHTALPLQGAADGDFTLTGQVGAWQLVVPTDAGEQTLRF